MPTQQELDAEKQARATAERQNAELIASIEAMQREFIIYQEAEKQRQKRRDQQLSAQQQRIKEMEFQLEQATARAARYKSALQMVQLQRQVADKEEQTTTTGTGEATEAEPQPQQASEFGRQIRASYVHQAMRQRKKRDDEAIVTYIQEMEVMGAQGGIEYEEVRQYIINGVTDDMKLRLTLLGASSKELFTEMLKMAERELQAERRLRYRNNGEWVH